MPDNRKPLGIKSYGHIPHLPGSKAGPGDHHCSDGQARIATIKTRDKHDEVFVQEKLDGSNVGIARVNGEILALTRAGYLADTSPYEQHHAFSRWVEKNKSRFLAVLLEGERLCGEWLMQAHGTRYQLWHEPFVAFDLMVGMKRMAFSEFILRVDKDFMTPDLIYSGHSAMSIDLIMDMLTLKLSDDTYGFHGALDPVEGAVWRVERKGVVDFLVKYVRPGKVDGKYLDDLNPVWNWSEQR